MTPLTDEEKKFYEKQKVCYICKKEFSTNDDDGIASNKKSEIIAIILENIVELLIIFVI